MLSSIGSHLSRKKRVINHGEKGSLKLSRVLTLVDLTALGVGSTLGLGVYVLAGLVSRHLAGPAVCISFLIAAIASALAGFCYSEFAARVPRAGSAYIYSYVCIGEFVAFVIGWNMTLEYIIGTASIASGLSIYIDTLVNNAIQNYLLQICPIDIAFLARYPDILAFVLVLMLTALLTFGIKESTVFNNVCTLANVFTIIIVIVAGLTKVDLKNWFIKKEDIPSDVRNAGEGGFLPFGFAGVMAGAAKCFFAFVGFDGIAATSEEAKNPQKNIPMSIIFSLIIAFIAYFGISTVLTMMWPYYDQNPEAPFNYVFDQVNMPIIKWVVTVGAICSLCAALLGVMLPMPRIIYSMSEDGLFFKFFAQIHPRWKTPSNATIFFGILSAIMALIFDLEALIDMMSIGTLLAYTIVAVCVITLRYDDTVLVTTIKSDNGSNVNYPLFGRMFNTNSIKTPTKQSESIVKWSIFGFSSFSCVICFLMIHFSELISIDHPTFMVTFVTVILLLLLTVISISRQPTNKPNLFFKVPWVPFVPCLCVFINVYLMLELDINTWVRFIIWMTLGLIIYFTYSLKHSEQALINQQERQVEIQHVPEIENTRL